MGADSSTLRDQGGSIAQNAGIGDDSRAKVRDGSKNGQVCWREKLSVSDLESSSLAGFRALIWSNLCTRHIPKKLTPREHHDWPDKTTMRQLGVLSTRRARTRDQGLDQ